MKLVRYEKVKAKTLLSKRINADSWFHSNHSMNIYRGCEFACSYCDGMSEYYHIDNYQTHIRIKENAPEILRRELAKFGYAEKLRISSLLEFNKGIHSEKRKPIIGISGGVSDSYQQSEKDHKLTRQVLKVLLEHELPVFLLTKSNLVLRDFDLLKEVNERAFCSVCFSIAFDDEEQKLKFEPKSSSIEERFNALKELRKSGILGGVIAMPIIPNISDAINNLRSLAKRCRDSGAEFILFAGMTIKPGRQKKHFLEGIKRNFPDRYEAIEQLYSNNDIYGHPKVSKLPVDVMAVSPNICAEAGVRWLSVRHGCPGEYSNNTVVLRKMLEILFILSSTLKAPRSNWKPYYDLAIKLEQGLPDIRLIIESNDTTCAAVNFLRKDVQQIIKTGTCDTYESLTKKALHKAKLLMESMN
ncbi:radical SAM protein [Thermoproteota archaeon]